MLFRSTIATHAGFAARGGDDPEVIQQGLRETLQRLRARASGEINVSEPSDEDLQRLTALKERELQDGPIGGFG